MANHVMSVRRNGVLDIVNACLNWIGRFAISNPIENMRAKGAALA